MLENMKYSFNGKHRSLKIIKGLLIVIKGKMKNDIYVLRGTLVAGSAFLHVVVTSDKTRLWHLMLGHISEKCLKDLSRQGVLDNDIIKQ